MNLESLCYYGGFYYTGVNMIIKKEEREIKTVDNLKGGVGSVIMNTIATSEQTLNHAKMYSNITLIKGSGIGYHSHENETEIILINEGVASYNDDGNEYKAYPGDVLICEDGHFHSIKNEEDEELKVTALVIYK